VKLGGRVCNLPSWNKERKPQAKQHKRMGTAKHVRYGEKGKKRKKLRQDIHFSNVREKKGLLLRENE